MLIATVRSSFLAKLACFLVCCAALCLGVSSKSYHIRRNTNSNRTNHERQDRTFRQKKPRSAQYGFLPQYRNIYTRPGIPVRLSSIPANSFRLPITATHRLANMGPLARLPALQRTYIPVVASIPSSVRYPVLQQAGMAGRYVLPYGLKMPASRLSTESTDNQEFTKHYNEKYNTLPSISNADMDQDTQNLRGKLDKKIDLADDFDHFLDNLDGPCSKNPCKNSAKCRISHDGTSFICICKKGFRGRTCQDKNPCFPNPCDNNGECTLTSEGFECSCPKGFQGKKCEQENKCEPNPCDNDGLCNELKNGEFECTCKKGYVGDKCQVTKKGCDPNPCLNDGQCSKEDTEDFRCTCVDGYTGKLCDRSDNKCLVNPCKNGGSCLEALTSLGYECRCPQGYRGPNCEDHSGCDLNSCQNGGTCYETEFGIRCICKNGYSGDKCQIRKFCDADTCQNNGKCVEHMNGFHCKCSEGYKGKMCEEMDRCRPNPCLHNGECVQSEVGYLCKCTSQFQGENCEVQNPCSENPCKNGGKCLNDLAGEYQCQCLDGYLGKNCEGRNACKPNPCLNNGVCSRDGSGFSCECLHGYHGKSCQESNPCQNNPCQNGGSCMKNGDTDDYTCLCPKDFKGQHCEAKRPCHPNPCINDGMCEETDDDFTCTCKEGFRGGKCEERDQCAPNPCKNGGRCTSSSSLKGYTCGCVNSFYGDTCEERNHCHPNPCANNGQCAEMNGGFTCQCSAGFKGDRCHEIDKCNPNPCQHSGRCSEVIGGFGYACRCAYGYKGQDCEQKDHCHPNPCDHDGQCVALDSEEGYQCKCSYGFSGRQCSDVNPCEPNPCQHDSQCMALPGFGKNHECNCSIGWSGDTCQKREMCQPNPCQFGTKCEETGEDSYSCVKSMCHPNPCQNSGKCINVNENNYQCACSDDFEGRMCEGDNVSTDLGHTINDDKNRAWKLKPGNKPETTNIDNLLKLVDTTLDAYNSKHSLSKQKNKINQVTTLLHNLKTNPTKQLDNGDEVKTNTDDDFTTHHGQNTKRQNVTNITNDDDVTNKHDADKNSDFSELDDDFAKLINPDGGVVVDNPRQSTSYSEQAGGKNDIITGVQTDDKLNKLPKTQNDMKQTDLEDSIIDEIHDEESFIKSINPEGEVVINNGTQVPKTRPSQLSNVPKSPPAIYSPPPVVNNRIPNPTVQLTKSFPQDMTPEVKSGKPPSIPMLAIASCSPFLCQNGGVCVQEAGKPIRCKCKKSFTGDTCEITKCRENPCQDRGTCIPVDRDPGFVCKCRDGLTGPLCSRKPCEPNPCKNGGDCVIFYSVYLCKCKPGFEGKHCEEYLETKQNDERIQQTNKIIQYSGNSKQNDNNNNPNNFNKNPSNNNNGKNNNQEQQENKHKPSPLSSSVSFAMTTPENVNQAYTLVPDDERLKSELLLTSSKSDGARHDVDSPGFGAKISEDRFRGSTDQKIQETLPSFESTTLENDDNNGASQKALYVTVSPTNDNPTRTDSTMSNVITATRNDDKKTGQLLQDTTKPTDEQRGSLNPSQSNNLVIPNNMKAQTGFKKDVLPISGSDLTKALAGLGVETEDTGKIETSPSVKNNQGSDLTKALAGLGVETEDTGKIETSPSVKNNQGSVCDLSPCENNAQCLGTSDGEFQCICSEDFSGPRCEDKGRYRYSSAPKFFPEENEECKHCDKNARCVNGHCICRNNFVGDGLECWKQTQQDKEWSCNSRPCRNGGTCKPGIARCVCRLGYVGDYCQDFSPPVAHLTFDRLDDGNKILDISGNGNDAIVGNGFKIASKEGKCANAGNMLGGDVLFDGQNFKGIPRKAITISAWVKLNTSLGIQSIFDTIGSHSSHKDGQYHFEIDNGRVRWFHRNEQRRTVFSVVTDQMVVNQSNWALITGTYSSEKNRARVYVNGDLIKEKSAHGMQLSGDWGGKAGIGKHEHRYGARVLRGMVDEFSIFPSELSRLQILVLMKHCKVYYNQVKTTSSNQFKETYSGIKPYAPARVTTAESFLPAPYQQQFPSTAGSYPEYASTRSRPSQPHNYPSVNNYKPAYSTSSYYSNPGSPPEYQPKTGYQQAATERKLQAGYQRTLQTFKQPVAPQIPTNPVVFPRSGYIKTDTPKTPGTNQYPWSRTRPEQAGSVSTQTPVTHTVQYGAPVSNQYQSQPNPYYGNTAGQAKQWKQYYSLPESLGASPGGYRDLTGTGSAPPETGNARSGQHYPPPTSVRKTPYRTPQTNIASEGNRYSGSPQTDTIAQHTASQNGGNIWGGQYQSILPTGKQQGGQYAPLRSTSNTPNGDTRPGAKGSPKPWQQNTAQVTSPPYADVRLTSPPDANVRITSPPYADVRTTPYTTNSPSGPSQIQNAYTRTGVYSNRVTNNGASNGYMATYYANTNSPRTMASTATTRGGLYDSSYGASATPVYDTSTNSYTAPSSMGYGNMRQNIPKPLANLKSETAHVSSQNLVNGQASPPEARTTQGYMNGPIYNKDKYNPVYYKQLDNNGQYPSVAQQYGNNNPKSSEQKTQSSTGVPYRSLTSTFAAAGANVASPGSSRPLGSGYRQVGNSQMGSQKAYSWPTEAQTPTAATSQWSASVVPSPKVDDAVMYNNGVNTYTSQTTPTPTATNAGTTGIPLTKNIDMDSVVQRALADFLTTHITRKKKKRKKRQDDNDQHRTAKLWR